VRPAQRADTAAVVRLWRALIEEHARRDAAFALRPGAEAELPYAVARLLARPDTDALLVWEAEGRVRGFCAARLVRAPPAAVERRRAEITELAVEPEARRRGGGRALVAAALAWAAERRAERVEVRVAARNPEGQGFWRALGFADFVDVLDRRL